jgi:archaeosine synthase beta-subunit
MTVLQPFSDAKILAARPPKHPVDAQKPYAFLVEPEHQRSGRVEDVAVVFLTNKECPFRCLMCDLWKHTTDHRVPVGAIPAQIDYALDRLAPAKHIKLYNSGNFFDPSAIPPEDYAAIAERVKGFATVIVENHPKLYGSRVPQFIDALRASGSQATLEVAMGLETIHPEVLPLLNKQMTTGDFQNACKELRKLDVALRAFILLRPPTLSESQGVEWAEKSAKFAFDSGVDTVSIIPVRAGNGLMDQLQAAGQFSPPTLCSMEDVMDSLISVKRGRVFIDLWDAADTFADERDSANRLARLHEMNLTQGVLPRV